MMPRKKLSMIQLNVKNKECQKYEWNKLMYNEICIIFVSFEKSFQILFMN
jgi:hypothetical protein